LSSAPTPTPTPTPTWTDLHEHGNGLKVLALVGDVGLETLAVGIKIRYLSKIAPVPLKKISTASFQFKIIDRDMECKKGREGGGRRESKVERGW
jgi:hypothetical protein